MEDITIKYPYYLAGLVKAYSSAAPGSEQRRNIRARIAANIGDRKILEKIAPEEASTETLSGSAGSSFNTIDSFLEKFGGDRKPLGYMMNLEKETPSEERQQEKPRQKENKPESAFVLREYIKNKRYQEAIQIIERQNLINPDKNIYFADQIRFLRKLIAIENFKTQPKG